jgi:hypothetical protein
MPNSEHWTAKWKLLDESFRFIFDASMSGEEIAVMWPRPLCALNRLQNLMTSKKCDAD